MERQAVRRQFEAVRQLGFFAERFFVLANQRTAVVAVVFLIVSQNKLVITLLQQRVQSGQFAFCHDIGDVQHAAFFQIHRDV